jgi:hypothetical protein
MEWLGITFEVMTMKLFLSWSGQMSQEIASVLHRYLPCIIQGLEVFMSKHDLESGVRWSLRLAKELDDSNFGIICLTPDNLNNPWILFEAGALTKYADGRACGLLFGGLKQADVSGPLSQFQNRMFSKDELGALLLDVNEKLERHLDNQQLTMIFNKWWPDIERECKAVSLRSHSKTRDIPHRDQSEILSEILMKVRSIERTLEQPSVSSTDPYRSIISGRTDNPVIKGKYLTIEIDSSFGENEGEQRYSYHAKQSLYSFLNSVFFDLTPEVKPFTLGTAWAIVDSETGERLHQLESDWSRGKSSKEDIRTLEEAGIQPGMQLRVIRL